MGSNPIGHPIRDKFIGISFKNISDTPKTLNNNIRWLLKEKYSWSESSFIFDNRKLTKNEIDDIKRIKKGEPVDYVIGWKEFLECHIDLSFKPLIPRPETEYWVGNILHSHLQQVPFRFNRGETRINVLDLCCGSGCIGIAVLKHLKNVSVDFADTDKNALAQTTLNLKLNREDQDFAQDFSNAYRVVKSNLFQNLKGKKYNYIFCNPPYVNKNKAFDKSLKFEPKDALFAKDEGLFLIKEILRDFNKYLLPNGKMYLEFGFRQKPKIESYLKQLGINKYLFNKDQYKRWRWVELKLNIAPTG